MPKPDRRPGGPTKIGDVLSKVLARYGYGQSTARLELETAWREVVGSPADQGTRVGGLRRGVLEILVDNAVLLQELDGFHKQRLLEQLQGRLRHNRVTALRFRRADSVRSSGPKNSSGPRPRGESGTNRGNPQ